MKDEEMAEESFKRYRTTDEDYEDLNGGEKILVFNHEYGAEEQYHRLYKQGFLAGLKAGRPQWHKVADGDLPKIGKLCLVYLVNDYVIIARLREDNVWTTNGHNAFENVIAWCEIPTFDKESK